MIKMLIELCHNLGTLVPWFTAPALVIACLMMFWAAVKVGGERKMQYLMIPTCTLLPYMGIVGTVAFALGGGTVSTWNWVLLSFLMLLAVSVGFVFAKAVDNAQEMEDKKYGVRAVPCPPRISAKDIPSMR